MSDNNVFLMPLYKYRQFNGRSRRRELFAFTLMRLFISVVSALLIILVTPSDDQNTHFLWIVSPLMLLSLCIRGWLEVPTLALYSRRLHDLGREARGLWIFVVPIALNVAFIGLVLFDFFTTLAHIRAGVPDLIERMSVIKTFLFIGMLVLVTGLPGPVTLLHFFFVFSEPGDNGPNRFGVI